MHRFTVLMAAMGLIGLGLVSHGITGLGLIGDAKSSTETGASDVERLIGAVLGDTPMVADLRSLTDEVGGRLTGSAANRQSVGWALERLAGAGVSATAEAFSMREAWQENSVSVSVSGSAEFTARAVAKPFSTATGADGVEAPLVDVGFGTADDFARVGGSAQGAWLLVETPVLDDVIGLAGLFREYGDSAALEPLAFASGALGIVYMSSRPKGLMFRHGAALIERNEHPLIVIDRESAKRALRIIRAGGTLRLNAIIDLETGGAYQAQNVIAEITGSSLRHEIVIFGAHLDSFDLGTGALDNGANVSMLIDIARQITRLGLQPRRTIRFALWNGEEQGMLGSLGYTKTHANEMDNHVVAASFDIGTGAITGFFTNGMGGLIPYVEEYLAPVSGLGPFAHVNEPIVGTDNLDFMLQGVPNLVANQANANYASNYHAQSDTFDKVDLQQLRLNAAIVSAIIWGFANDEARLPRQTRAEIEDLVENTSLGDQLKSFGIWIDWETGERGRSAN